MSRIHRRRRLAAWVAASLGSLGLTAAVSAQTETQTVTVTAVANGSATTATNSTLHLPSFTPGASPVVLTLGGVEPPQPLLVQQPQVLHAAAAPSNVTVTARAADGKPGEPQHIVIQVQPSGNKQPPQPLQIQQHILKPAGAPQAPKHPAPADHPPGPQAHIGLLHAAPPQPGHPPAPHAPQGPHAPPVHADHPQPDHPQPPHGVPNAHQPNKSLADELKLLDAVLDSSAVRRYIELIKENAELKAQLEVARRGHAGSPMPSMMGPGVPGMPGMPGLSGMPGMGGTGGMGGGPGMPGGFGMPGGGMQGPRSGNQNPNGNSPARDQRPNGPRGDQPGPRAEAGNRPPEQRAPQERGPEERRPERPQADRPQADRPQGDRPQGPREREQEVRRDAPRNPERERDERAEALKNKEAEIAELKQLVAKLRASHEELEREMKTKFQNARAGEDRAEALQQELKAREKALGQMKENLQRQAEEFKRAMQSKIEAEHKEKKEQPKKKDKD